MTTGDSQSHGWGSAALVDVQRGMLGVEITAPAGVSLHIRPPCDSGLTRARGTVWTQAGTVTVAWALVDAGTSVEVTLPADATAEVDVPVAGTRPPRVRGTGASSARLVGVHDGYATYTVGAGHTVFAPRAA